MIDQPFWQVVVTQDNDPFTEFVSLLQEKEKKQEQRPGQQDDKPESHQVHDHKEPGIIIVNNKKKQEYKNNEKGKSFQFVLSAIELPLIW